MNVSRVKLTWLALVCWLLSGSLVWSQTTPSNPLRSAPSESALVEQTVARALATVPTTSSESAVRQASHAEGITHRHVSFGFSGQQHYPQMQAPRHEMIGGQIQGEPEVVPRPPADAEIIGEVMGNPYESTCCGGGGCQQCLIACPSLSLENFEFFGGAHGFTGPANRGETGSFGMNLGFNWASRMPCAANDAFAFQFGYRYAGSNFSGAQYSDATRNQHFITAGLFRRVDWGLQGGLVLDYMGNSWYNKAQLTQLRGEISWMYPQCHELGFWFAASTRQHATQSVILNGATTTTLTETFDPTSLFAFFYRRRFEDLGAEGRFYAGFSDRSDGLIGADFTLPVSDSWALESTFAYLIPKESNDPTGFREESWNVAVGMTYYPGCKARLRDYFRPLFDVADNGSFMVDRQ